MRIHRNLDSVFLHRGVPLEVVSLIDVYVGVREDVRDKFSAHVLPDLLRRHNEVRCVVIYYADHRGGNDHDLYHYSDIVDVAYKYVKTTDYDCARRDRASPSSLIWRDGDVCRVNEESARDPAALPERDWYVGDNINADLCYANHSYISSKPAFVYKIRCWYTDVDYSLRQQQRNPQILNKAVFEILPSSDYDTIFAIASRPLDFYESPRKFEHVILENELSLQTKLAR